MGRYGTGQVSSWIPDGSKVADAPRAVTNDEALEVNFTPALMTNRNLTINPLPAGCGAGMDVTGDAIAGRCGR